MLTEFKIMMSVPPASKKLTHEVSAEATLHYFHASMTFEGRRDSQGLPISICRDSSKGGHRVNRTTPNLEKSPITSRASYLPPEEGFIVSRSLHRHQTNLLALRTSWLAIVRRKRGRKSPIKPPGDISSCRPPQIRLAPVLSSPCS
jgi:hypothetical protein